MDKNSISIPRMIVCLVLSVVILLIFIIRLFQWQIIEGDYYRKISNIAASYSVSTEAVRGEILDCNGEGLAVNVASFNVVINKLLMNTDEENNVLQQLIEIFTELKINWIDDLPIVLSSNGRFEFVKDRDDDIKALKSKDMLNMNTYSTADECLNKLAERYELNQGIMTDKRRRDLISVRYGMEKNFFSMTTPYVFAKDIDNHTASVLSEKTQGIDGVEVRTSYSRKYLNGTLAPHLIGTIGALTAEEYEELKNQGYYYNDTVGKGGIEYAMESYLRGTAGTKYLSKSADGIVTEAEKGEESQAGNTVYLTLDTRLQEVANKSLKKNVNAAGKAGKEDKEKYTGEDCVSGAAVMLSVDDFSILAAATYPSYDLTKYSDYDYYSSLLENKATPLYNRAFNGIYAPGSIFKPCVAAASLEEKLVKPSDTITCTRVYDFFAPDTVSCMGYHGSINLLHAMAYSCNYYFAELGRRLGIDAMYLYAERFGLGVSTGVEVYESIGILAGRDNSTWYESNTVKAAIGQSDNAFTPLQLATYAATIANDGVRLKTHLVDKVVSYDRTEVIYENGAEVEAQTGISKENMKHVQKAMRAVAEYSGGTAHSIFGDYDIPVAAKTGTAENSGSDHVTFICYAPYENPEVAVAVVLEHGAKGKYSMSVAKDMLDAYFADDNTNAQNSDDTDTQ